MVKNTSAPESVLSKKLNAVNYHIVRESTAVSFLGVAKEDTNTNLADPLTRLMPYSKKQALIGPLLVDY